MDEYRNQYENIENQKPFLHQELIKMKQRHSNSNKMQTHSLKFWTKSIILLLGVFCMTFFTSVEADASHFRYGQISWVPDFSTPGKIDFTYNGAWRRSIYCGGGSCVGNTITVSGGFNFGDGSSSIAVTATVVSEDVVNDIINVTFTVSYNYSTSGNFTVFTNSCCRIGGLQHGSSGNFRVESIVNVDLSDWANNNSPPNSSLPSIVTIPSGSSPAIFNVPGFDPDGNPLTFRLSTLAESGINPTPGMSISTTGTVTFDPTPWGGSFTAGQLFPGMIVIEDGQSKTMVDFLMQVSNTSTPPDFDYGVTPANNVVMNVQPGSNVNFDVKATDVDAGDQVVLSVAGLPTGPTLTPSLPNAAANPSMTNFDWTPTLSDVGNYVLTFTATDNTAAQTNTTVILNVTSNPTFDVPPTLGNGSIVGVPTGPFNEVYQASDANPLENVVINGTVINSLPPTTPTPPPTPGGGFPVMSTLPAGLSFSPALPTAAANPASTTLSGPIVDADWGIYNLEMTATDDYSQTDVLNNFFIVNRPPAFTTPLPTGQTATVGVPYSITISGTDPDIPLGDAVAFAPPSHAYVMVPSWITTFSDDGNGNLTLSGTPTLADVGNHSLQIELHDRTTHFQHSHFSWKFQNFDINVQACQCDPSTAVIETTPGTHVADCEQTIGNWTHYCNTAGNILLSIKKDGVVSIPTNQVEVEIGASLATHYPQHCTGTGGTHSGSCFIDHEDGSVAINRTWHVLPSTQPDINIPIRFYFSDAEYQAINTELGNLGHTLLSSVDDMWFYKASLGPHFLPHDLKKDHVNILTAGPYANLNHFESHAFGSDHYVQYMVSSFSGGSGGGTPGGAHPLMSGAPHACALLSEDFSTTIPLATTDTDGTWYPDRFPPNSFQSNLNGELEIHIHPDDGAQNRPGPQSASFYNTQGRKYNTCGKCVTRMSAKVYIPLEYATDHRRTGLWGTAYDGADAISWYPILSFRNVDGASPTFSFWDGAAFVDLGAPAAYDQWYEFAFEIRADSLVYFIDGVKVGGNTAVGTEYLGNMIIQAYNFNDNILPSGQQSADQYTVLWDDVLFEAGGPMVTNVTQSLVYCSIQLAIDDADPGDVIEVAPGTYFENVIVHKPLTINGPLANVDPRTVAALRTAGSSAEAIIDGGGASKVVEITAPDVILNGFEITNGSGDLVSSPSGAPVKSNIEVKYCIVHNSSGDEGIQMRNVAGGSIAYNFIYNTAGDGLNLCCESTNTTIDHNEITQSASGDAAMYLYGNGPFIDVTNNDIYGVTAANGMMIGNKSGSDDNKNSAFPNNADVADNTVIGHAGSGVGIYINTSRVNVTDNLVSNWESAADAGLYFRWDIKECNATGNTLFQNVRGVKVSSGVDPANTPSILINYNAIFNNTDGLLNSSGGLLDATCNWWGANDPIAAANANTGNVDFIPYSTVGSPAYNCDGLGPVVVYEGTTSNVRSSHLTIQEAIDDAATVAGDVIVAAAGTYTENVVIDKTLELRGANYNVNPCTPAWMPNPARVTESIIEGTIQGPKTGFTVDGFTILGNATGPIFLNPNGPGPEGTVQISNNIISGEGIADNALFSGSNLLFEIQNNKFENFTTSSKFILQIDGGSLGAGEISGNLFRSNTAWGMILYGSISTPQTISGNMFDQTATAMILGSGGHTVDQNIFTNTSGAIYTEGDGLIITNNDFQNSNYAVYVNGGTGANHQINNNQFAGGNGSGVSVIYSLPTGQLDDVTCNFWTTEDPTVIANKVSGDIEFLPFLTQDVGGSMYPWDATNSYLCNGLGLVVVYEGVTPNVRSSHMTIQEAIDDPATVAGDLIEVAAGTYNENVVINKGVILRGNNSGTPCGSRVAESIIAPASGTPVTITADGVWLDGFEITAPTANFGITCGNTSNLILQYLNIHDIATTAGTGNSYAINYSLGNSPIVTSSLRIFDNCIDNVGSTSHTNASVGAIGILNSPSTGAMVDVKIESNEISNINVHPGPWPTGKIAYGIQINVGGNGAFLTNGFVDDAIIKDNTITNLSGFISTGIALEGNTEDAVVTYNDVSNLIGHKSAVRSGGGFDLQALKFENNRYVNTCTVEMNNFHANTFTHNNGGVGYAIANYVEVADGGTLTTSCNWLGDAAFADIVDNPAMDGRIFNKADCNTLFVPYWSAPGGPCDGAGPVKNLTKAGMPTYATIQQGVDDASSGDVLELSAYTFTERVIVDKSLTIQGATGNKADVVLDGAGLPGTGSGIHINTNVTDVTIKDLTVKNYTGSSSAHAGIAGAGSNHNTTVTNVHVDANLGGRGGLYLNGHPSGVDNVLFDGVMATNHNNPVWQRGIVIWNGHKSNITIQNCVALNNACCGIELQDGSASGVLIDNNIVHDNADNGIGVIHLRAGDGPNIISNNDLEDNGRFGIEIKNPEGNGMTTGDGAIVVENNDVEHTLGYVPTSDRDYAGIAVFRRAPDLAYGNPDIPSGVVVRDNIVRGFEQTSDSDGFGIVVEGMNHTVENNTLERNDVGFQVQVGHLPYTGMGGGSDAGDQLNLMDDYFGRGNAQQTCGITDNGQLFGVGAQANGTDFRAVGFFDYGAQNSNLVQNNNSGNYYCYVQEAIDSAMAGDVIEIQTTDQTDLAQIVVDKSVSIIGQGKGSTTLHSNYNTASSGHGNDASAWIRTNPGTNVIIEDMTLDATGFDTYTALRFKDGGEVNGVGFNEIKHSASPYLGIAVQVQDGTVDIDGCMFTQIGRIGVHYRAGVIVPSTISGTYSNNMYTGKGVGDWLDYALDISGGTTVVVDNNEISENKGVASSDGSTSAGILVTSFFPGPPYDTYPNNVTITGNDLHDNTSAVSVGYNPGDISVVNATGNDIYNNDFGMISNGPVVNAEMNYWGAPDGPGGDNSGSGDPVDGPINACPFYDAPVAIGGLVDCRVKNTTTLKSYDHIQDAIDDPLTLDGHTLTAAAGDYIENVIVHKELTINGPNVGVSPNTGVRVGEAIVYPDSVAVDFFDAIFKIEASNVTVDGLTFDGDNTNLTSGVTGTNGADIDAGEAVSVSVDNVNNLVVQNNIVQNLTIFGVNIYGGSTSAPTTTGHLITDNFFQDLGTYDVDSSVAYWGGGVLIYNDQYTRIVDNTMENVRIGVQTGNFHDANTGTTDYQVIDNNTIQARRRGVFYNLHTGANVEPWTVSNNNITALDDINESVWDGILMASLSHAAGLVQDNTIDGSGTSHPSEGFEVWNVSEANPVLIDGGSASNVDVGVFVNNYDGYISNGSNNVGAIIDGVDLTASVDTGIHIKDNVLNTNGLTVFADIRGNTDVSTNTSNGVGILVTGPDASADIHDNLMSISGNDVGILVDSGFVSVTENTIENNNTGVKFINTGSGIVTLNNLTGNALNGIENATGSPIDGTLNWWGDASGPSTIAYGSGDPVSVDVDYCPWLSATYTGMPAPVAAGAVTRQHDNAVFCDIQSAIDDPGTSGGHVLLVAPGVYDENIDIYKSVVLEGANAGVPCGARGPESVIAPSSGVPVIISADGVTLIGFEVTAPTANYAVICGNRSSISLEYNYIHHIGNNTSGNVHAINYTVPNSPGSPSNVNILDNCIEHIGATTHTNASASAIGILQSTTTGELNGLYIRRNAISDVHVHPGPWPTGKIAYGIVINVGGNSAFQTNGKVVNAAITDNTITNLSGFISTGIGLEGNTENAIVTGNDVSNLTGHKLANRAGGGSDLQALKFENNQYVGTCTVEMNNFRANTFTHNNSGVGYAIANYVTIADGGALTSSCNWHGSALFADIEDNVAMTGLTFNKVDCSTSFIPYWTAPNGPCNGAGPVQNITQAGMPTYHTIQDGIDDAAAGEVLVLSAHTFTEHVIVNKPLTIQGATNDKSLYILDGTNEGGGDGFSIQSPDVTIQNVTVQNFDNRGLHTQCGTDNLTLENFATNDNGATGIAINGIDGATMTDIMSNNNIGNGVSITDCNNTTITNIMTSGNSFGGGFSAGIGLFSSTSFCTIDGISGFDLLGTVSIAEPIKVYSQLDDPVNHSITGLNGIPLQWANGIGATDRFYWPDKLTAYGAADAAFDAPFNIPNSQVYVVEIATENFYVEDDPGIATTVPMSIGAAVDFIQTGKTIFIEEGDYDEQVEIDKSVVITKAAANKPIINLLGSVVGNPYLFDVSVADVTIDQLQFEVDLTKLGGAILASGSNIDNLSITDNMINPYGSSAAGSFSYGLRNAVSVNYAAYRVASGGVNNITFTGNMVTALPAANPNSGGVDRSFRSGISLDEGAGVFNNNNLISINHDILIRFNGNGPVQIDNNTFGGGGVQVASHNAGGGQVDITNNLFDSPFANAYTSSLRLQYNNQMKQTNVTGNTFNNHNWGISLENYNTVLIDNNNFTPLPGSTDFRHITINTKAIVTDPIPISQTTIDAVVTNNTFNGSGVVGGQGISFYNHDNTAPTFGTFTIGTAGNENTFDVNMDYYMLLDDHMGMTQAAVGDFPEYGGSIGDTPMDCWGDDVDVSENIYDGLKPDVMSVAQLSDLEMKLYDDDESANCDARLSYVFPIVNVSKMPNESYVTIQEAIDDATAGDSLVINTVDHTEPAQVVVDKDIILSGLGKTSTVLRPGFSTGASGDARGFILVNAGVQFDMRDMAVDGFGQLVYQAVRTRGSGTVDNVYFTEIKYNESGPHYAGVAVAAFGNGNVDVQNCMFDEIGRVGVLYFGAGITGSTYFNNMYTGKGAGDWLDYAAEVGAGAVVTIDSNVVANNLGAASSDGSTSAGFLATTFFGPGTNATFTRNTISGNTTGISVGADPSDLSTVVANYNNITFNATGVSSTAQTVDATLNWWGDASGPSGQGPGTGDAVSVNVEYCPWLDNTWQTPGMPVDALPVAICKDITVHLDTMGVATITAADIDGGSFDPCEPVVLSIDTMSFDCNTLGANTVTLTVTDGMSQMDQCMATVTVVDTFRPSISMCPDDTTMYKGVTPDPYLTGWPMAVDVCDGSNLNITWSDDRSLLTDCNATGMVTRTFTVSDQSGNFTTCEQIITVLDTTPPTIVGWVDSLTFYVDSTDCMAAIEFDTSLAQDTFYVEGFEATGYVSSGGSGIGWNDYNAHVHQVASGTDGITSFEGNFHAVIDTTLQPTQGAYTRLGGYTTSFADGWTARQAVYLDLTDPMVAANTYGWDLSAAANGQDGAHQRDFIFHAAAQGGVLRIGASNNSSNATPANVLGLNNNYEVTQSGWYQFTWHFRDSMGALAVDLILLDEAGNFLWKETRYSAVDLISTEVGGNRYLWFTFIDATSIATDGGLAIRYHETMCNYAYGDSLTNGTYILTCTAEDLCDSVVVCNTVVTVLDTFQPALLNCPMDVVLNNTPNNCNQLYIFDRPDVFDACGSTTLDVQAFDENGSPLFVQSFSADKDLASFPVGVNLVLYIATDSSGFIDSCSFTVTVNDIQPPSITNCPANITKTANAGACGATVNWTAPTASDNCPGVTLVQTMGPVSGSFFPVGTTTVEYTATDDVGLTATCTFIVTVSDDEMPMAVCQDVTVYLDASGDASLTTAEVDNGSSDNCGIASMNLDVTSFDCTDLGMQSVTLTVTDVNGNMSSCMSTVSVLDTIAPTVTCAPDITVGTDGGVCEATSVSLTPPSMGDNCSIASATNDAPTVYPLDTTTVTWTITDAGGNVVTCEQKVVVIDTENPDAVCQNLTVYLDGNGDASINPADVDGGSSDNCTTSANLQLSIDQSTFDCNDVNTGMIVNPVTELFISEYIEGSSNNKCIEIYNGTGATVNLSTYHVDIYFNGNTSAGQSIQLTGSVADGDVHVLCHSSASMASDQTAGGLTFNGDDAVVLRNGSTQIDIFGKIGEDPGASWNVDTFSTANQTLVRLPTVYQGNVDDLAGFPSLGTEWLEYPQNTSTYLGSHTLTPPVPPGSAVTVVLTVEDEEGNTDTCQAQVTVLDTVSPTVTCQSIDVYLDVNGQASITTSDVTGSVSDNCFIDTMEVDVAVFGCGDVGANMVTLTATDVSGNSSSCMATVTVIDTFSPTALCQDITVQLDANGMATITVADVDNGSSDACGVAMLDVSPASFNCSNVGINAVTLTVTDNNGNTATCTANVTIEDNVMPTAQCQDVTVYLDASGMVTVSADSVDNGSSDACGISTLSLDQTDFNCSEVGANSVILTVTDVNGNQSTCGATVTVVDTVSPTAMCRDYTVYLEANGMVTISVDSIDDGSSDACGVSSLALDQTDFTCTHVGPNTVTLTVTDDNGNMSTCTATVTVVDTFSPVALCQDITIQLDVNGMASITGGDVDAGSSDACGVASIAVNPSTFNCTNIGANVVTLTVTDNNGNTSMCTANVTVEDVELPTALCRNFTAYLDANGQVTVSPDSIDNGSSDNCGIASISLDQTDFDCSEVGANSVILTVTDVNGNQSTCGANVTVVDTVSPTAMCRDFTAYLDVNGMVTVSVDSIDDGSSDACGVSSLALDQTDFTCTHVGSNTVTLTVTDINGNTSTCTATVTVVDTFSPVALCQDITVQLDANGMASITGGDVDAGSTDACGIASVAVNPSTFNCTNIGANVVTLTVTDNNGNSSICTANVTVEDVELPTALCRNFTAYLDANGQVTVSPDSIDNGSSDNCGIASITLDETDFDCSEVGLNSVILTVTDVNGNMSTCGAVVTVVDTSSPVAVCKDFTVYLDAAGMATVSVDSVDDGSSDNCGIASIALDQTDFTCTHVGPNTVTLTVIDDDGNMSSCTAIVTVVDTFSPVAVCQDITVQLDANGMASVTGGDVDAGSTDVCGIASVAVNPSTFNCSNIGANVVTLTVTDNNGNSSMCTANVTVEDNVMPTAQCQDVTVYLDASGMVTVSADSVDNGSSDACGISSLSLDQTDFDCSEVGANSVILTVTDVNGNQATCGATVTVVDTVSPTAQCQNITVYLDSTGMATVSADSVDDGSSDACGIALITLDQTNFGCSEVGANTVTLTVTDMNNNVNTCTAIVTVIDTFAPVASCQNITAYLDAGGVVNIADADIDNGSSDACGILLLSADRTYFDCSEVGPNNVTLTVLDNNGNSSTCTAVVTVADTTAPLIVVQDVTLTLDANGLAILDINSIDAGSSDNCGLDTLYLDRDTFTCADLGLNQVQVSAIDENGNNSTQTVGVTIEGMVSSSVVFVDQNANGLGTGLSWENAFSNLDDVFNSCISGIDTIKVAQGLYIPSGNNREAGYKFTGDVVVLGGYANQGATRETTGMSTILSGDIGAPTVNSDNVYHVVEIMPSATNVVIDGFTIVGGYADGSPVDDNDVGAGVFCRGVGSFSNVIIDSNFSYGEGSAAMVKGSNAIFTMKDSRITSFNISINGIMFGNTLNSEMLIDFNSTIID